MSKVVKHFIETTAGEGHTEAETQAQIDEHKNWVDRLFELILTDDSASIARLEVALEIKQMEAVDEFIENTDWGSYPALRPFRGEKGSPAERLEAFRHTLRKDGKGSK